MCANEVAYITDSMYNSAYAYLWSDLDTMYPKLVSTSGSNWYKVKKSNRISGCYIKDSMFVTVNTLPKINLSKQNLICLGDSLTIGDTSVHINYNYTWLNGVLSNTQKVSPKKDSIFILTVTDKLSNCLLSDTVLVSVNALPIISLAGSAKICGLDSLLLEDTIAVSNHNYLFSNGVQVNFQYFKTTVSQKIYLEKTNKMSGCKTIDSIWINAYPLPNAQFSTVKLSNEIFSFSTKTKGLPYYKWDLGDGEIVFNQDSIIHRYISNFNYKVVLQVKDSNECTASADSVFFIPKTCEIPLKLYPNPALRFLTHDLKPNSDYIITDMLGRIVTVSKTNISAKIDISYLASGQYFLYTLFDNCVKKGKFVVIKD